MQTLVSHLRIPSVRSWSDCTCSPRQRVTTRSISSTSARREELNSSTSNPLAIYVSKSHDPHFNLAYEDWLFRKTDPSIVTLYMYRNSPSVIIGRNQNPWKEIDLHRLKKLGIPFIRRKSGGGTVYHDLGNTNYCVFVPRTQFERKTNAEMVARALNKIGIEAYRNDRNDICVDGFKIRSAFKLVNSRAYHHGTMLIDAKLGDLKGVLGNSRDTLITKGVASVPSPVKNLRESSQLIDHQKFVDAVAEEFGRTYGDTGLRIQEVDEAEKQKNAYVSVVIDELQSWDWKYGQTPEFTHDLSGSFPFGPLSLHITSRHALITSCSITTSPSQVDYFRAAQTLCEILIGEKYATLDGIEEKLPSGLKGRRIQELITWLKREM